MDSTAEENVRDSKRARLAPSASDVDLIGRLEDDVLLRVLGLAADARDAVRTGVLARRWRGLWTRAPALRFAPRPVPRATNGAELCAAFERYVSLVNDVLVRRAQSGCVVETLEIMYTTDPECDFEELMPGVFVCSGPEDLGRLTMPAAVSAAQAWIRYAFEHGVKSLILDLRLPLAPWRERSGENEPTVFLDESPAPSPAVLSVKTMHLALGGARIRLPSTLKFTSLTDLSLESIKIADGGALLLAHLLSSASCPCLQKLRMSKLWLCNSFMEEMQLEADVLSELWIEDFSVMSLNLRTPSLRVLHMDRCYHEVLRISAPILEELEILFPLGCFSRRLEVDRDFPCVRTLKLRLLSHRRHASRYGEAENDKSIQLLSHCTSLTSLDVTLHGPKAFAEDVDLITSRLPHLNGITSLTINVSRSFERHDFGGGVVGLLTRFSNLRSLNLHLPSFNSLCNHLATGLCLKCDHQDYWQSHEIPMAHLQELELTGLTGTDCELWFMKAVLASTKRLHKVAISFYPKCWQHQDKMDAFERMLVDEGMCTFHRDTFMLNTSMN